MKIKIFLTVTWGDHYEEEFSNVKEAKEFIDSFGNAVDWIDVEVDGKTVSAVEAEKLGIL